MVISLWSVSLSLSIIWSLLALRHVVSVLTVWLLSLSPVGGFVYPEVPSVALEPFMEWRTSSILAEKSLPLSKGRSSTLCCSSLGMSDE